MSENITNQQLADLRNEILRAIEGLKEMLIDNKNEIKELRDKREKDVADIVALKTTINTLKTVLTIGLSAVTVFATILSLILKYVVH